MNFHAALAFMLLLSACRVNPYAATASGTARCDASTQSGDFGQQFNACKAALPKGGQIDATGYGAQTVYYTDTLEIGSLGVTYTVLVDDHSTSYQCKINNPNKDCVHLQPGSAITDQNTSSVQSGPPPGGFTLADSANVRDYFRQENQGVQGVGQALNGIHAVCGGGRVAGALLHLMGSTQSEDFHDVNFGNCENTTLLLVEDSQAAGVSSFSITGNGTFDCNGRTGCVPAKIESKYHGIADAFFENQQFNHAGPGKCQVYVTAGPGFTIASIVFKGGVMEASYADSDGFCVDAGKGSVGALHISDFSLSAAGASGRSAIRILNSANLNDLTAEHIWNHNAWINWVKNDTTSDVYKSPGNTSVLEHYTYTRDEVSKYNVDIRETRKGTVYDLENGVLKVGTFGPLQLYTRDTLPACTVDMAEQLAFVKDETSACTKDNVYAGGGGNKCQLQCSDAGKWKINGVKAY